MKSQISRVCLAALERAQDGTLIIYPNQPLVFFFSANLIFHCQGWSWLSDSRRIISRF